MNLNIIERFVIESLQINKQNSKELQRQTNLNLLIIQNTLSNLIAKNLVITENKKYAINPNLNSRIKKELKNKYHIQAELSQIMNTVFNLSSNEKKTFHLKKFYLSERDEKIFNGLVYNIESFINSLETKSKKTSNNKIFFWGGDNYENIINHYITN